MRVELPVCKRCCFCLPLRYGLIAWGYLKLIVTGILSVTLFISLCSSIHLAAEYKAAFHTYQLIVKAIVLFVLLSDSGLTIIFLVGGHMKNVKLLRIYYFYSIAIWILTVFSFGARVYMAIASFYNITSFRAWILVLDCAAFFINIVLQAYFILLINSEVNKLRKDCEFRFVNNAAQSECTMKCVKEFEEECGTEDEDVCERGMCVSKDTSEKTSI